MLQLDIPSRELFDDETETFIVTKKNTLQLEHSLVSLSKWESKWCKPFLSKEQKTDEETLDYVRCMTITQNVDPAVYLHLPDELLDKVNEYINAPMTATWFREKPGPKSTSSEVITSEVIYYWMISQNVPMECQKWHLNRLLTLIRVCSVKNAPVKKRSQKEMLAERRAQNEARRRQYGTKG